MSDSPLKGLIPRAGHSILSLKNTTNYYKYCKDRGEG